jgi:hypothetical protein
MSGNTWAVVAGNGFMCNVMHRFQKIRITGDYEMESSYFGNCEIELSLDPAYRTGRFPFRNIYFDNCRIRITNERVPGEIFGECYFENCEILPEPWLVGFFGKSTFGHMNLLWDDGFGQGTPPCFIDSEGEEVD